MIGVAIIVAVVFAAAGGAMWWGGKNANELEREARRKYKEKYGHDKPIIEGD